MSVPEHKTFITPEKAIKADLATKIVQEMEAEFCALSWKHFKKEGRGYLFRHFSLDIEHLAGNDFEMTVGDPVPPMGN